LRLSSACTQGSTEAILLEEVPTGAPPGTRLEYADILAILRATHRHVSEQREEVKERRIAVGRAIATGGLAATRTTKREIRTTVEEREQVLYIFRRSGAVPWILHSATAQFAGLGAELGPTRIENFARMIRLLRERAPSAAYDERLLSLRKVPERARTPDEAAGDESDPSTRGVDLLAHILALWFARAKNPYRM
jgi:hypothetical protein